MMEFLFSSHRPTKRNLIEKYCIFGAFQRFYDF